MNINLVHPSLNKVGGAERVSLSLIRIFKEEEHFITLYTIDKVQWNLLERTFGNIIKPDKEVFLYKKIPDVKSSFLNWIFLTGCYLKLMISSKKDKHSISLNNYGEVFPIICDICYINSIPLFSIYKNSEINPYRLPLWPLTSKIYYLLYIVLRMIFKQSTIITNSKYNSEIIKKHTIKSPLIIYPPTKIMNLSYKEEIKEDTVLTISRITKKKNLTVIPKIAKEVKATNCRFVLMGKISDESDTVLKEIKDLTTTYHIKGKVNVIPNPTQSLLRQVMAKSSIYLSTQPSEAFGMAIIEAMASGCIPVVPKAGGPWIDILDQRQGHRGYAFTNVSEAAEWIDIILSKNELRNELAQHAKDSVASFDELNFRKKFLKVITKLQNPL